MKSIFNYLKERFPFTPLFVFAFLTISGLSSKIQIRSDYSKIALLSLVYTGFLFHLRILDEFKDFEYDNKYHPDRPVQRGAISINKIKYIGIVNFIVILITSIVTSRPEIISLFVFVIFYSLLMFKEFFIEKFYEKSVTLYLISHQIVFIPLYIFFYSSISSNFWFPDNVQNYSLFIYTLIPIILIEIGRKMNYRFDEHGKKTNDTYLFVWGERKTIGIFSLLVILSGLFGFFIKNYSWLASTLILILGLFLATGGYLFPKKIIKLNMVITVIFVLGLPALLLI